MSGTDWRNVRVKEEPMSDVEDARGGSRSRGGGYYDHQGRGGGGGGERGDRREDRRDRRDKHSSSPPPTHSRKANKPSRFSRSRSRSPPPSSFRERESDRDRGRNVRERSRSRERMREPPQRDDRDRRRPPSRERESQRPDIRRVKTEPRGRSPSPNRGRDIGRGEPNLRENRGERGRGQGQSSRGRGGPPRDGGRERDWDNFFNPNSDMSKQAFVKREKGEQDRKLAQGDFGQKNENEEEPPKEKEQPNFGLSGKLTEEANTFRGVVIKYSEPPEARKPNKIRWRLYPFKGEEALPVMYVHRQSAFLLGRERKIADIPIDHPSCSKQHAVLQYRLVPYTRQDGSKGRRIKPYIIDLESANGTFVNGKQIEAKRYVELFEKDVLKFGFSSREYVLLHDESKGIEDDLSELTPE